MGSQATDEIRSQYASLIEAMQAGDYERIADSAYPKVIELMGGREAALRTVRTGMQQLEAQGLSFHTTEIQSIAEPVKAGKELHSIVRVRVIMKAPGGKVQTDTYSLAISQDDGASWFFLDSGGITQQLIDLIFPVFTLELPPKSEPMFLAD